MSQHGIHAILLVLTTSARFTAEEVACLNYLRSAYGGQLLRHCILVFTHGDSLEEEQTPLEEFLRNCPESLQVRSVDPTQQFVTQTLVRMYSLWPRAVDNGVACYRTVACFCRLTFLVSMHGPLLLPVQ